ncbi:MAG: oligopeptidase Serine peptidase family, partial [Verrucomicrobiales bacterium]|nr:oligopeptidase Serine peptidase family [Verrucomicrobiales bacterium]
VIAYLNAENAYMEAILAPTKPLQEKLYQEMLGHLKETDTSAPVRRGEWLYYSRTEQGKNYAIHCRKHGNLHSQEEIILDVNQLAAGHKFFNVGLALPSDDNSLLAFTTDTTGYRQYTLEIKDLRTGKLLPQKFERVDGVVWAPDNKTLFFVTEDEVTKRSDSVHRHVLGTAKTDRIYFEPDELFDVEINRSLDRMFLFIGSESKLSTEFRFLPLEKPTSGLQLVQPRTPDHKYFVGHRRGLLYIRTNDKAKNYRVMTVAVESPAQKNWKEYLAHDPSIKIEDLELFSDHDVISERVHGLNRIRIVDLKSNTSHSIELPEPTYLLGTDANPEFATNIVRFHYQSLVTPNSIFDYDINTHERRLVKQTEVLHFDSRQYQSERIFATASDGTKIPCSIVYKKGMKRDGSNPLFLNAYGSYGISMEPYFSYSRLALLDRGMIYVIAHIRGGGEMGEIWRDQGRMKEKMNTFTDFNTCAEYLIREKYTSADRLVIEGGSAGGLLMGAVVNLRPDLFKAVIAKVPFVDVLNTMLDPTLPLTTSEYIEWGNPNIKDEYQYIRAYSPYDNVRAQNYPAMLVRVSLNDSQVPYWEGAKWVAKLRTVKTGSNPLLLKTNMGAGHGGASGRYDALHETAFDYAFFLAQLGMATP